MRVLVTGGSGFIGSAVVRRLVHDAGVSSGGSLIDFNRSGVALMEIVTEPDLRSPLQAREFLTALRRLLQFAEVSTGRMEEGTLRCDANVSLQRRGGPPGTRTEVKNMNSIRSVERALAFEIERQRAAASEREGARFSLRAFHDRLLALGSLPLTALHRELAP